MERLYQVHGGRHSIIKNSPENEFRDLVYCDFFLVSSNILIYYDSNEFF